jgi:hypothetical protein
VCANSVSTVSRDVPKNPTLRECEVCVNTASVISPTLCFQFLHMQSEHGKIFKDCKKNYSQSENNPLFLLPRSAYTKDFGNETLTSRCISKSKHGSGAQPRRTETTESIKKTTAKT